jgi:hypothetical protein
MIAYELREAYAGTVEQVLTVDDKGDPVDTQTVPAFSGGVIALAESDLNVAEALEAGGGRIVADENTVEGQQLINALDYYPALKRVSAEDSDTVVNPLERMNNGQLRSEAARRGVKIESGANRDAILKGLTEQAARAGEDDLLVVPSDERTVTITKDGALAVVSANAGEEA